MTGKEVLALVVESFRARERYRKHVSVYYETGNGLDELSSLQVAMMRAESRADLAIREYDAQLRGDGGQPSE